MVTLKVSSFNLKTGAVSMHGSTKTTHLEIIKNTFFM